MHYIDLLRCIQNNETILDYIDYIDFGRFTPKELKEALEDKIPSHIVMNSLNKSTVLKYYNLAKLNLSSSDNYWRFFYKCTHQSCNFDIIINALERFEHVMLVFRMNPFTTAVFQIKGRYSANVEEVCGENIIR